MREDEGNPAMPAPTSEPQLNQRLGEVANTVPKADGAAWPWYHAVRPPRE